MKLATYLDPLSSESRVGLVNVTQATITDLQTLHRNVHGHGHDLLHAMQSLLDDSDRAMELLRSLDDIAATDDSASRPLSEVKLLAPLPEPRQIREFSVYPEHLLQVGPAMAIAKAKHHGLPIPELSSLRHPLPPVYYEAPAYYHCNRFNVIGPGEDIVWPRYSKLLDYELELCMFTGRKGKNIRRERAADYIFGYSIFNDVSARAQMFRDFELPLGPTKGKSFDTGSVVGPWIVTKDELVDVQAQSVEVWINDEKVSENTTAGMVHTFEDMISYVSTDETIHPGEMFGSGTIPRCCGAEIDRWIAPGDTIRFTVSGIGELTNRVVGSAVENAR